MLRPTPSVHAGCPDGVQSIRDNFPMTSRLIVFPKASSDPLLMSRRLLKRRLDEYNFIEEVVDTFRTQDSARPVIDVAHAGSVGHRYGYPSETEVALVCVLSDEQIVVWGGRANARRVTKAGASEAAWVGASRSKLSPRLLFDKRYRASRTRFRKRKVRDMIIREARRAISAERNR